MDNQNNPNWPNNPTPVPPFNGTTPSTSDYTPLPDQTNTTAGIPPLNPSPTSQPNSFPSQTANWTPSPQSVTPPPFEPSPNTDNNPFPNPLTSQPTPPFAGQPDTWNPTPPAQMPTPEPAQVNTVNSTSTFPQNSSPLDNPWGNQSPIAPQVSAQPTWVSPEPIPQTPIQSDQPAPATPVWAGQPQPNLTQPEPTLTQPDSAPTDLSHLISNNPQLDSNTNNGQLDSTNAQTLVTPSPNGQVPEVPTVPLEEHKGMPKWLIGVGLALLLTVAGASAYFILGIGQHPQSTTSIPAEVSKTTIKTAPPITTSSPQPTTPAATESANFGQLGGSSTNPPATSAAELLKQRQQGK